MNRVAAVCAVVAVALGVAAAAVFGLHDRQYLVSPPEAVVEQFARKLQTGRYDRTRAHLAAELAGRTDSRRLRAAYQALEARQGPIEQVEGQAGSVEGDRAWASAIVTSRRGPREALRFPLVRRCGEWRLAGLEALMPTRSPSQSARVQPRTDSRAD